ncbi:unnamed protein product, partial [Penicillium discolor]
MRRRGPCRRGTVAEIPRVRRDRAVRIRARGCVDRHGEEFHLLGERGGGRHVRVPRRHVMSDGGREPAGIGHREGDRVGAGRVVLVRRRDTGSGVAVAEVPRIAGDRTLRVARGGGVESHRPVRGRRGELRRRQLVQLPGVAELIVLQHLADHRRLIDRADPEGIPFPGGVAAHAPVAVVVVGTRLRVRSDLHAIHEQLHPCRRLLRDDMVPLPVTVGARRREDLSRSVHVDVPVVVRTGIGIVGVAVPEADQLAAARRGGLEPGLDRIGVRRRVLPRAHHRLAVVPAGEQLRGREPDGLVRDAGQRSGLASLDRGRPTGLVRPGASVAARVFRDRPAGLAEAPVQCRVEVVHGFAVGVCGRSGERRRAPRSHPVRIHRVTGQRTAVHGHVRDAGVEVVRRPRGRPAALGVPADAPHHARAVHRADHVVPLAVVETGPAGERPRSPGVHAERDLPRIAQVEVPVVASGQPLGVVAEADDLPAARAGRLEPCLDRELVRTDLGDRTGRGAVGAVEGRGGRGLTDDLARLATGRPSGQREVVPGDPVGRGRTGRLVHGPVIPRRGREHGFVVRVRGPGGRDRHRRPVGRRGVPVGVGHLDPVLVCLAGGHRRVGVREPRSHPVGGVGSGRVDRLREVTTEDLVGQAGVVGVVVRGPGDACLPRAERLSADLVGAALDGRTDLVRRRPGLREAHESLLCATAHGRELTAVDEVVATARDRPCGLIHAGHRAGLPRRVPVQQTGRRVAGEAAVPVDVRSDGAVRRVLVEREREVEAPRVELRELSDVAAVMRVRRRVEHTPGRVHRIGVAVAILHPHHRAVAPARAERAFEVVLRLRSSEVVPTAVDAVPVGGERIDGGAGAGVADDTVDRPGEAGSAGGVERGHAATRVGRPVGGRERAGDDHLRGIGGHHDGADAVPAGEDRVEVEHGTGRRAHGRDAGTCGVVDVRELPRDVHGRIGGDDALHDRVGTGGPIADQLAGGRVEGRQTVAVLTVDGGEAAADVQPRAVGRHRRGEDAAVDLGGEGCVEHTGCEIVGEEVGSRRLVGAGRRSRRARARELPARVHLGAAHRLSPDDAVDLRRRQRVSAHRRRQSGIGRHCIRLRGRCGDGRAEERGHHDGDDSHRETTEWTCARFFVAFDCLESLDSHGASPQAHAEISADDGSPRVPQRRIR